MTIIAEIGQNWCGDLSLAKHLIEQALECGGDLCKFQLYDSVKLYGEKQDTELTKTEALMLFNYGKEVGIEVFFSVFDVERVGWCEEIGVKRYKIACDKMTDELFYAIPPNADLITSYSKQWGGELLGQTLLCVPRYPAWITDYELDSIKFPIKYDGISDHTIGLDCAKIALSRGAEIIEKHFAIDHETGVDAEWSMTPEELKELKRFESVVKEAL